MSYSQALEEQLFRLRGYEAMQPPSDRHERLMFEQVYSTLSMAESYYWAPDICTVIRDTSIDMPKGWKYRHDRLPTAAGFAWFPTPIGWRFPDAPSLGLSKGDVSIRAMSWKSAHFEGDDGSSPRALILCGFGVDTDGELVVSGIVREGEPIESCMDGGDLDANYFALKIVSLRVFAACMSFLEQRILIAPQQRAERQTRKRLEREGFTHEPLIRVVELRRKHVRSEHHGDSEPVEWSHQWIVSGHWRQQWYPSLNANQPIWVMPYVKGPEDKPLKPPRAKVFAVVR